MPLRDHFRPPLDDVHSWEGLLGGWPAMIVQNLNKTLPESYFAAPGVHLGTLTEVARATIGRPKQSLEPRLPGQDVYEVRIYDSRQDRRFVAAMEIVSPSNKERPETRAAFVAKVAALLKHQVCVSIIDVVSTTNVNLYSDLLNPKHLTDPALGQEPPSIYTVTIRTRYEGERCLMDNWYYPLSIGNSLPMLPIWLTESLAVSLDLEASYEETCRILRIR